MTPLNLERARKSCLCKALMFLPNLYLTQPQNNLKTTLRELSDNLLLNL